MACPGSRLSDKLRRKIEGIGRTDRKDVVGQTADGCAPLFWACKNGSAEVVDYLLITCDADIAQVSVSNPEPSHQMYFYDLINTAESITAYKIRVPKLH